MLAERLARALDEGPVTIRVRPGKRANRLVHDEPFTIEIAARAIRGDANRELTSYLKRIAGPCIITSGSRSHTKRIERVSTARP